MIEKAYEATYRFIGRPKPGDVARRGAETDVIVSDLSGEELTSGIEIAVFGSHWPTRHFTGAIEACEFALTKSENRYLIRQGLEDVGIHVTIEGEERDDPGCKGSFGLFSSGCSGGRCCK